MRSESVPSAATAAASEYCSPGGPLLVRLRQPLPLCLLIMDRRPEGESAVRNAAVNERRSALGTNQLPASMKTVRTNGGRRKVLQRRHVVNLFERLYSFTYFFHFSVA
jgi:hypothetical protein